jgi:glycerol-3-phosphate dehydrogenase
VPTYTNEIFGLVREALAEREVLLRNAPHLIRPMRFVMPHVPALRPAWMIRIGLFLYDSLARRDTLPGSHGVTFAQSPYNSGLQAHLRKGFVYSDCWVDDARLVIANARAAAELGATVLTRTQCLVVRREGDAWCVTLRGANGETTTSAKALLNATGPWAKIFIDKVSRIPTTFGLRLVKGSHIVVPRLYEGEHAFILQNDDRRVVFVYPYQEHYTLIGTTDVVHTGEPGDAQASDAEVDYLCRAANRYFTKSVTPADVAWRYAGIRPLFDDGANNPSQITRDYTLRLDGHPDEPVMLSVFGGKITTYRRLAEHALDKLQPWFPAMGPTWTAGAPLPGGDLPLPSFDAWFEQLHARHGALPKHVLLTLAHRHGARVETLLDGVKTPADLGQDFGNILYAREVDYLVRHEWAATADDILWRRTKAGLQLNDEQKQTLTRYLQACAKHPVR